MQLANAHGDIVNGAEPLPVVGEGVVESAAEVESDAVSQRQAPGQSGAARRQPERFHHLAGVRNLELHQLHLIQRALL